jgi:AcrR family transcriptional regulator
MLHYLSSTQLTGGTMSVMMSSKSRSEVDSPTAGAGPRTGRRIRRGTAPALLLGAARELFAERGHRATTTRQIAERAGVSEELIFRYYGSKNGLLQEAVIAPLLEMLDRLRASWVDNPEVRARSDEELLRSFLGRLHDAMDRNRTIAMIMVQILTEKPEELDVEQVHSQVSELFEPLAPAFGMYLAQRGLRGGDPALMLRLMMVLIGSVAVFLPGTYPDPRAVPDRDRILDEVTAMILYGLQPPPEGAR